MTAIRPHTPDDWRLWKDIRLESLHLHPEAYGNSYEEASRRTDADFRRALEETQAFGAFQNTEIVGVARFSALTALKQKHRGSIFSVYVKKEGRGQGVGDALVETVIEHAKTRVEQIHCAVIADNLSAVNLYKRHGFTPYGTEPRFLKIGGRYYDELLMVRML